MYNKTLEDLDQIDAIIAEGEKATASESELSKNLEELSAALEAGARKNLSNFGQPVLQVEDLSEMARPYLSASARYDQAQKVAALTVQEEGRVYRALYFATKVLTGDEERAVEYLARILNDLSQRGLSRATLAPLSSMKLARLTSVQKSVVYTFVLIPEEFHADVKRMYPKFVMEEGDCGRDLYEMSPTMEDGEFVAVIRLAHNLAFMGSANYQERLKQDIDQYLAVLPRGTQVRKITELAITDLSYPFEVKLYNPLLAQVKRVETDYCRAATPLNGRLEQFNVFRRIRYFDKDDKELYV